MKLLVSLCAIIGINQIFAQTPKPPKYTCQEFQPGEGIELKCTNTDSEKFCPDYPVQTKCDEANKVPLYKPGSECFLTCKEGYMAKPLLKKKDGSKMERGTVQCPDEDPAIFKVPCGKNGCDDNFECIKTEDGFGISSCDAPKSDEIRTSFKVEFPKQDGPYFVTEIASGKRVVHKESLNPFPSGTFIFHEYTKDDEYVKTCMEYSIMGLSSASNKCVGPAGVFADGECTHGDGFKDPKLIQDTKDDCEIPVVDATTNIFPNPVEGCEYTEFMARQGFKTCSSTATTADDKGCKFHVHSYTLDTQNLIARDAACLGYVGGHYDPLGTREICGKKFPDWSKCEQGDLSGKWKKLSRDTPANKRIALKADTAGNEKVNLNIFTRGKDGDEGAFSRALVFHSPADKGKEAWFCGTLGKSCTGIPQDPKKDIGPANPVVKFDAGCQIERTTLLYVWEGTGKKYLMYAGEDTRMIPGRKKINKRQPSIYNINWEAKRPGGPPPPPPDQIPSTTTRASVGFIAALIVLVIGW